MISRRGFFCVSRRGLIRAEGPRKTNRSQPEVEDNPSRDTATEGPGGLPLTIEVSEVLSRYGSDEHHEMEIGRASCRERVL